MKDAKWDTKLSDFTAIIIYSTNNLTRPVSSDFASRVKYIGSMHSSGKNMPESLSQLTCSILICDLKKGDSGEYSFRYVKDSEKWATKPNVTLTVEGKSIFRIYIP